MFFIIINVIVRIKVISIFLKLDLSGAKVDSFLKIQRF